MLRVEHCYIEYMRRAESIVVIITLLKVLLTYGFIYICYNYYEFNLYNYIHNFPFPKDAEFGLLNAYLTWDAQFYWYIAENGYGRPVAAAFYPLYPVLMRGVGFIVGNPLSGFLISIAASLVAMLYLFKLCAELYGERVGIFAVVSTLIFPSSFFLSLVYSEALFLMIVILFFWFFRKNYFLGCILCAFFLPLTRPVGVLLCLPLAWLFLIGGESRKRLATLIFMVLLGFTLTHFIVFLSTGDLFLAFKAQQPFSAQNSILNFFRPIDWFSRNFIDIALNFHGITDSAIERLIFALYLLLLFYIWKFQSTAFFLYALIVGMVPAFSGLFMSYSRLLLVCFPIFIQSGIALDGIGSLSGLRRTIGIILATVALGSLVILQLYFVKQYSLNNWVG